MATKIQFGEVLDMDVGIIYILCAFVVCTVFYVIARFVDYGFSKLEDKRRYQMAKNFMRHTIGAAKQMSIDTIKEINKAVFDMAEKWDGD